jgi:hypothetical protein
MSHSSAPERATGTVITEWRPEDPAFWQQRGQRVASRNLWISVPCLLLAFCVWMLFSAVAVNLPKVGFNFTTDQLFMLTALPSLSGALLRVPYAFMVRKQTSVRSSVTRFSSPCMRRMQSRAMLRPRPDALEPKRIKYKRIAK